MSDELLVKRLGIVPYLEAWELQKELAEQRRRNEIPTAAAKRSFLPFEATIRPDA